MKIACVARTGFVEDLTKEMASKGYSGPVCSSEGVFIYEATRESMAPLSLQRLIFARDLFIAQDDLVKFIDEDRIGPILERIEDIFVQTGSTEKLFHELRVFSPEQSTVKNLGDFCRKFAAALERKLLKAGAKRVYSSSKHLNLYVVFLSYEEAIVGYAPAGFGSPWLGGIPRLRQAKHAPSRSYLKLAEAFALFFPNSQKPPLEDSMMVADLGAAPGGWTYFLTQHGVHVDAVDNADLDENLVDSHLVRHWREDAFKFQPKDNMIYDWVFCDVVESPFKTTDLILRWIGENKAKRALFNLKLPMKKRWECLQECLTRLDTVAKEHSCLIKCKQLYHDRDEVTVLLIPHTDMR